ncbi:MAG: glycosyltransferase [Candidatus Helarchaeota archaeon]
MRIAMVSEVPTFNPILPNGVSSFIEDVSRELVRRGHEVHVFEQLQFFGQKRVVKVEKGITIHRLFSLPASNYQNFRIAFPLKTIFFGLKLKFDIIHAHGPILGIVGTVLGKKQNCPKIVTYHTPGDEYRNYIPSVFGPIRSHTFVDWFERLVYCSFDMILTPAEQWRKKLIQRGYKKDRILVLPNCIDLNANHKRITEERIQEIQKRYNLDGKNIVVYVGRMSPEKNIPEIIKIAPQVVRAAPDTHFLMVGKGPFLSEYKRMAKKVAPHNVTFTGYVSDEDLANILHMSRLGVIFVDGAQVFDITLLNYWSNHVAVCARRAGGMGDVVTHGENGMLFRENSEALDQILSLLQDDALCRKIANKGYQTVKEKYSVRSVTTQLLEYYKMAAKKFHYNDEGMINYFKKYLIPRPKKLHPY